ncbi:MAG: polysaccharide pyruvyl transferase family protein [Chloroflexi bacterium]|nr:MAG: polysaccharide pyruvyl transferase family protein [Chloroflexota bacterium]
MYILLHGAKKNVGDFLIFERARELIRRYRKTDDLIELPRWESLAQNIDLVNKSDAIIWCGGPGYAFDFYPNVLPLVKNLTDIKVPIIPMGLGWAVGEQSENIEAFSFNEKAHDALHEIHSRISYSSVRDILTEQVVRNAGINNVVTTGCAAWSYLPNIEQDFVSPKSIQRIVVTSPAKHIYFKEAAQVVRLIGQLFPGSERYLVFHRGILPDKYTPIKPSVDNILLALSGYRAGFRIVDASYSTDKIKFYETCDFHVGYRVHAHIDFLSLRKPSILLQEDARGIGQSLTLKTKDVRAGCDNARELLQSIIIKHQDTNFNSFHQTIEVMKSKHAIMRDFIQSF